MSGAMGGGSGSDPTAGVAASWATQQMNSAQARPDEDKYKKQQAAGGGPFGNDPFGSDSGGGGGMI